MAVGGHTIAELKNKMTYEEFMSWRSYIVKRGSLNVGSRLERGFALVSTLVSRAAGWKANMEDFMPHAEKPKSETSIFSVFNMLKSKAKKAS